MRENIIFLKSLKTMNKNKNKLMTNIVFVSFVAIFCTILWGTAFPAIKIGYQLFMIDSEDIPSKLIFAGGRFAIAGMIVLFLGSLIDIRTKNKDGSFPKTITLHKKDILPIAFLGLFQTFFQYLLLYTGIVNVTGTRSAILTSVAAFGSMLISAAVFPNDKITVKKLVGCIIGFIGLIVMNLGDGFSGFTFMGDGLVIMSNLSGAVGNVISKKISGGRSPFQISGWQLVFGGTGLTVIGVVFGGNLVFHDFACFGILIYLAAVAGLGFMLWTMLLFFNDVSKVAVFNLLIPVFGTMWSGIFLSENIFTFENIFSLTLVCAGIFLVNFKFSKSENKK